MIYINFNNIELYISCTVLTFYWSLIYYYNYYNNVIKRLIKVSSNLYYTRFFEQ